MSRGIHSNKSQIDLFFCGSVAAFLYNIVFKWQTYLAVR